MRTVVAMLGATAALIPLQSVQAGPLGPVPYDAVAGQVRALALDHNAMFRRSSTLDCTPSTGPLVGRCAIRFNDSARSGYGARLTYIFFRSGYDFAEVAKGDERNLSETRPGQRIVRYRQTMMVVPRDQSSAVPFHCFEAYGRSNSMMSCVLAVTTNAVIIVDINPAHDSSTEQSADRDTEADIYHAVEFLQFAVSPFIAVARSRTVAARPQQDVLTPSIWKESGPVARGRTPLAGIGQMTPFDLNCTGTMLTNGKDLPHAVTYHIDIRSHRYCGDKCSSVFPIVSISSSKLVLNHTATATNKNDTSIDLRTGAWLIYADQDYGAFQYRSQTHGVCKPAPFTGLAPRKHF